MNQDHYVPALKYSWLTRFYDPVVAMTTREKVFRPKLLDQANLKEHDKVLDLACGTGTFAILVKTRHPGPVVCGLDGDPQILSRARKKAQEADLKIAFDEGMSYSMPYPDEEFDVVFSSLFFHHLMPENKTSTLKEVLRVLKPGGRLEICDWGRSSNPLLRAMFLSVRLLDGFEVTRDNAEGRLLNYLKNAGFTAGRINESISTMLGSLDMISAIKPENRIH